MPGRTRPIDKFAQATAKCAVEVSSYQLLPYSLRNNSY